MSSVRKFGDAAGNIFYYTDEYTASKADGATLVASQQPRHAVPTDAAGEAAQLPLHPLTPTSIFPETFNDLA